MRKFIVIVSLAICIMLSSLPAFATSSEALDAANALYELGLFNGTGTDENGNPIYDLDRQPTRHEAITMLVRLLGKESEALSGTWDMPFTDVAEWAKPYVGYAYTNGLTNGTGTTTFGGDDTISATQYLTFILRVLGYKDGTDFRWDAAYLLTDQLGITSGEYADASKDFLRGDVAIISYQALSAAPKGSTETLSSVLGVDSQDDYVSAERRLAMYYLHDGDYYDNGLGTLYEVEYQGKKELYITHGELLSILEVVTNSVDIISSTNPFIAGRYYSPPEDYKEGDKVVFDYGDLKYVHWEEYISINEKQSWIEYRYNGNACAFIIDTTMENNIIYEQNEIKHINITGRPMVNIQEALTALGIEGTITVQEIDDVGLVWSFN